MSNFFFPVEFTMKVLIFSSYFLRESRFSHKLILPLHRFVHLIRLCFLLAYMFCGHLHMGDQRQDDQREPIYSSSLPIRDEAPRTSRKQWTIENSRISVLMARCDDDDDDMLILDLLISVSFLIVHHYMFLSDDNLVFYSFVMIFKVSKSIFSSGVSVGREVFLFSEVGGSFRLNCSCLSKYSVLFIACFLAYF